MINLYNIVTYYNINISPSIIGVINKTNDRGKISGRSIIYTYVTYK